MAEKVDNTHSELAQNGKTVQPKRQGRFRRHCARFWWLHILIFIAIVLIVVLPVIYVGYPAIARHVIKKSGMDLISQYAGQPASDSFTSNFTFEFLTNSSYKATLKPFNATIYLADSDKGLFSVETPEIPKAHNGTIATVSNHVTSILNMDEFDTFTRDLLINETITVYLKGKGDLKLGALPSTSVHYDEEITTPGMNGLKGTVVTYFRLLETDSAYSNAVGEVAINNPSVVTLEAGNVTLKSYSEGILIANGTMFDVTFLPGNHTYPVYFTVNETSTLEVLEEPAYRCGTLPVTIELTNCTYGGKEIPWLVQALNANNLTTSLDVAPALEDDGLGSVLGSNCTST